MKVVKDSITLAELKVMAVKIIDGAVKAVVDIEKEVIGIDVELHSDGEVLLLEQEEGAQQQNLWGINLHPENFNTDGWIEYNSMINYRPSQDNRSRGVEDHTTQEKIRTIVNRLVKQ